MNSENVDHLASRIKANPSPEILAQSRHYLNSLTDASKAFALVDALLLSNNSDGYSILKEWFRTRPNIRRLEFYVELCFERQPEQFIEDAKRWIELNTTNYSQLKPLLFSMAINEPETSTINWMWHWLEVHSKSPFFSELLAILIEASNIQWTVEKQQFVLLWMSENNHDASLPNLLYALLQRDPSELIIDKSMEWIRHKENLDNKDAGGLLLGLLRIKSNNEVIQLAKTWVNENRDSITGASIVANIVETEPSKGNFEFAFSLLLQSTDPDWKSLLLSSLVKKDFSENLSRETKRWFDDSSHSIESDYMAMHNESMLLQSVLSNKSLRGEFIDLTKEWIENNHAHQDCALIMKMLRQAIDEDSKV
jgi:hypothetical protein